MSSRDEVDNNLIKYDNLFHQGTFAQNLEDVKNNITRVADITILLFFYF